MKRDDLIRFIGEALRIEEEAVASYAKHITATITFGGFSETDQTKIRTILKKLEDDSRDHAAILMSLKNRILEDNRDVY